MNPHETSRTLEICIDSVEDAVNAENAGASRLELNSALALGGLTPSLGLLQEVKQTVRLPVMVMIRPRSGGFAYNDREFQVMLRDGRISLDNGADGLVFGILSEEGNIDVDRCRRFLREVPCKQAVFHRAFDVVNDPLEALEQLIDLGFRRIMTSGQEQSAYNGISLIAKLIEKAGDRIEILPAGGINRFTVEDVVNRTGCRQIHCSLRETKKDNSVSGRPQVYFGGSFRPPEDRYDVTAEAAVSVLAKWLEGHP